MGELDANLPLQLWSHPAPETTQMWIFKTQVEKKYNLKIKGYDELYGWSIENVADFWREVCLFTGVHATSRKSVEDQDIYERGPTPASLFDQILPPDAPIYPRPDFFPDVALNFAENLLYPLHPAGSVDGGELAIIAATETSREEVTWDQLRQKFAECYHALKHQGVKPHDRVAGFVGHNTNAVVAMLATTALGAIWTAVSPDTGVGAVLDRLQQIEPVVLFADNASLYNGKTHETTTKVRDMIASLPKLGVLVVFEAISGTDIQAHIKSLNPPSGEAFTYGQFLLQRGHSSDNSNTEIEFDKFPASHPAYILYSSGTTGKPKCIVHSAGGTLIQHKKEHIIHGDILPGDRLFYFTTTTWMMWHWLISGLSCGATLILYDGSPFFPHGPLTMPKFIDELQIKQFGTSAKFLSVLEQKNVFPNNDGLSLASLKAVYSTGSPLAPSTFQYVTKAFGSQVQTASITGGTDIISLFGAPCPLTPVYQGEIQQKGLGMSIFAVSPDGTIIIDGSSGDLICTKPFPSQPVTFFGPDGPQKYKESYFETFTNVWHHGDFIRFNPSTGGMVMLGRSDGILKPAGVRFGSAEIYNVLLKFFSDKVEDALCIGRRRESDSDEMVVLFLKMSEGGRLDEELRQEIKSVVRRELSARHVPGVVEECVEIPVTTNGKKVEVAVKQILCGMDVKTSASVANSECLNWYREWAANN
ncbi:putative acetoacetyl-CoA synthetase [Amylocarpus encephaloides]|uniref:Acetoacetyl-CoA synthetase n=1 Tax=Amylocarpus encephaloides TaxID=45428 RepID=A0A9P7YSS1_9HELO|nr:putative acetoacetyl-CoA synthetase [Amylocarpus encephaloides]